MRDDGKVRLAVYWDITWGRFTFTPTKQLAFYCNVSRVGRSNNGSIITFGIPIPEGGFRTYTYDRIQVLVDLGARNSHAFKLKLHPNWRGQLPCPALHLKEVTIFCEPDGIPSFCDQYPPVLTVPVEWVSTRNGAVYRIKLTPHDQWEHSAPSAVECIANYPASFPNLVIHDSEIGKLWGIRLAQPVKEAGKEQPTVHSGRHGAEELEPILHSGEAHLLHSLRRTTRVGQSRNR